MNAVIAIGGLIVLLFAIQYGLYCFIKSAVVIGVIFLLFAFTYISAFFLVTDVEMGQSVHDRDCRVFPNAGLMFVYKPIRFYDVFINPWLTGTRCSYWVVK